MGEEAESILSSTDIKDTDKEKYDLVMAKLDAFFQVRKNVMFERAKFNRRIQLEGESVEQFITTLYTLVETCKSCPLTTFITPFGRYCFNKLLSPACQNCSNDK